MPTPSIQTLRNDAQQVLNLDSISAVRSVVAATLANANAGTPLNPNMTTQQLWNEFYQIVTQPKSDIESIIANQLMKFLFAPPAPGGAGANHEVIYNNNGVLAGDPKFLWDDALNKLDIDGSATISGDLTVDTNVLKVDTTLNRVGINNASPAQALDVAGSVYLSTNATYIYGKTSGGSATRAFGINAANDVYIGSIDQSISNIRFNSGGGDLAILNSTGLGVGAGPGLTGSSRRALTVNAPTGQLSILELAVNSTTTGYLYSNATQTQLVANGATFLAFETNAVERMRIDTSGNVGIGVAPSAWSSLFKAIQINNRGAYISATSNSFSTAPFVQFGNNGYYDSTNSRWQYVTANTASQYVQAASSHLWYTAASGSAGAEITDFATAKMTLDASGNLSLQSDKYFGWGNLDSLIYGSSTSNFIYFRTNATERMRVKSAGQVRFVPLASDPAGAEAGDVYYNSSSNKLKCYNGTTWNDLF